LFAQRAAIETAIGLLNFAAASRIIGGKAWVKVVVDRPAAQHEGSTSIIWPVVPHTMRIWLLIFSAIAVIASPGGLGCTPDALRLSRLGVGGELAGEGQEVIGNLLVGLHFGFRAAGKTRKMTGDGFDGADGVG